MYFHSQFLNHHSYPKKSTGLGGGRPMSSPHSPRRSPPNGGLRSVGRLLYIGFRENVSPRKLHQLTLYFPRTGGKNPLLFDFIGKTRWYTSKCLRKTRLHWCHTRQIIFRKKKGGLQMSSTRTLLLQDTQSLCISVCVLISDFSWSDSL
jgi:hypothetical protein